MAAVVAALSAGLAAGCSGGGDEAAGDSGSVAAESEGAQSGVTGPRLADRSASDGTSSGSASSAAPGRAPVQTQQVISTGRVSLVAKELEGVRGELDRLLGTYGGHVAKERTTKDDDGRADHSELELRVPSRHFDRVMAELEGLARVTDAGRKAVDVTTEVIDVDSRIRTQEVSLDRLRGFLGEAADVNEMIRLEAEIARREAELASLRAQQDYLSDQTSLATISLTMVRDHGKAALTDDSLDDAGFVTGLRNGWEALVTVLVVAATVLGAVLPFAAVLAALGVPLWLVLSGRTARARSR